jgi:hypothetical protein
VSPDPPYPRDLIGYGSRPPHPHGHGYAAVAIGVHPDSRDGLHWRRLVPLLRHRRVALPPRHLIRADTGAAAEARRLAEFLGGYDLPVEEQHRWRV